MNPLIQESNLPFGYPAFDTFRTTDFKQAVPEILSKTRVEIQRIASNPELPTFENTLEAMELAGEELGRVSSIFFNLNSAETNDELQQLAMELSPQLAAFQSEIYFNADLFKRIDAINSKKEELNLSQEQLRLLEINYRAFVKNGASLNEEKQRELKEINRELAGLSVQFGKNVLGETNDFYLELTQENELAGLPKDAIAAAKNEADSRELSGWVFSLQYPSYLPFMKYSQRRDLREKMYKAFGSKSFKGNDKDNQGIIKKIVNLRQKKAEILGFKSHAEFTLQERMASSPKVVLDFLNELYSKAEPYANEEINQLKDLARELDGIQELMPWDHLFYSEKLKQQKYDYSENELKKYFPLNLVLEGLFDVAKKLFNIDFQKINGLLTYADKVQNFEVTNENGEHIAVFMADFFPRKGKRAGAWMTSYREQSRLRKKNQRPIVSIVCNFSPPQANEDSYLTFNEVRTLYHEFGHALHGMLSDVKYGSLSGTNVYWDFVELPSQFMENFALSPKVLKNSTKHKKTGAQIPDDLIKKVVDSAFFMEAYGIIRQVGFGLLDMAWHHNYSEQKNLKDFENQWINKAKLYPEVPETCMSTSFSHIFQGGYSAGYYSYKWAEVLDADAFELFKEKGLFNEESARSFKKLLSSGGTKDPMELYVDFRGRKPDSEALLRRAGLS